MSVHADDSKVTPENRRLAQQELWVAEGSDWCWWYGPEHSTANDENFDILYRKHLSNIYRLLGGSPMDELAVPIKRPRVHALTVAPSAQIHPKIDGRVTTYFEWMGAGLCQPDYRSGSMHGVAQIVEALYYGYSDKAVYLRVDLGETFLHDHPDFEIRVNIDSASRVRLHAAIGGGAVKAVEFWKGDESLLMPLGTGDQVKVAFQQDFRTPARLHDSGRRAARTDQRSGFHLDGRLAPSGSPSGGLAESRIDGRFDGLVSPPWT